MSSWARGRGRARLFLVDGSSRPPEPPLQRPAVQGFLNQGPRTPRLPRRHVTPDDWLRGWGSTRAHYRDVIEPRLLAGLGLLPDLPLRDFAELYLRRHAAVRDPNTIETLRNRLVRPLAAYGDVRLSELETDERRAR